MELQHLQRDAPPLSYPGMKVILTIQRGKIKFGWSPENRDSVGMDSRPPQVEAGAPDVWRARFRGNDEHWSCAIHLNRIGAYTYLFFLEVSSVDVDRTAGDFEAVLLLQ